MLYKKIAKALYVIYRNTYIVIPMTQTYGNLTYFGYSQEYTVEIMMLQTRENVLFCKPNQCLIELTNPDHQHCSQ